MTWTIRVFVPDSLRIPSSRKTKHCLYGWKWRGSDGSLLIVVASVGGEPLSDTNENAAIGFGVVGSFGSAVDGSWVGVKSDACDSLLPWLVFQQLGTSLSLSSLHPPHYNHIASCQFYHFRMPRSSALQYMSLEPLILDLALAQTIVTANATATTPIDVYIARHVSKLNGISYAEQANPKAREKRRVEDLIARNLLNHIHLEPHNGTTRNVEDIVGRDMKDVLDRINESHERSLEIRYPARQKAWNSLQWVADFVFGVIWTLLKFPLVVPTVMVVFTGRLFAEFVLMLLNRKLFSARVAFKDLSTFGHQVNLRLQQACFWPGQYNLWRRSKTKLSPLCQAQYVGFYNVVWLIANDIIIGVTLGSFLMINKVVLAHHFLEFVDYWTLDGIKHVIEWLMGWPPPAGLKLNSELNGFLGQLFLWILYMWRDLVIPFRENLPSIIYWIGVCGYFGASVVLSLLSDLVSLFTMQLFLFYVVAAKIYSWQVDAILSLLTIFRGKKLNVLRNRVDSSDFDVDQLLVGALLFTLLVFLFPTVAVYYLLFSLTRVGVIVLQGGCEILLAFLNHFPLFAIMLRVKDPSRLPGGVRFQLLSHIGFNTYMSIENVPIGANIILYQYVYIVNRLINYYLTSAMTSSFFTGRTIERVPRLQAKTLYFLSRCDLPTSICP
ncbi:N-acetylglucosaminyl transferase component-domain-containing protein [Chytriomyces sp. MP71]|nr:N-acetylglucosaminyl transferase component-domain-containing protein [Chytriomyces sp. MP71]